MESRAKGEGGSATSEAADGGGGKQADGAGEGKGDVNNNSMGDKAGDREGFKGDLNKQAEKDFPKAPRPIIGMNDERGSVSFPLVVSNALANSRLQNGR